MKQPNTFTDRDGKTWTVKLTLGTLRSVKDAHGVDLAAIATDPAVLTALDDPCKLAEVIGCMVKDDLQRAGMSQEAFENALDGDTLGNALLALVRAIRDFLPSGPSKIVGKLHDAMLKADSQRDAMADRLIQSGQLDRLVEDAVNQANTKLDELLDSAALKS